MAGQEAEAMMSSLFNSDIKLAEDLGGRYINKTSNGVVETTFIARYSTQAMQLLLTSESPHNYY